MGRKKHFENIFQPIATLTYSIKGCCILFYSNCRETSLSVVIAAPIAVALALWHSELIIHDDIGSPPILKDLRAIAPVVAVRGNIDRREWAQALPP